ncbi:MAG: cell wall-active antibiotics response protein [Actinomycetia bacterium]|nr:cell wall-active antibiotics response protein [Actinomycetes bacterium]
MADADDEITSSDVRTVLGTARRDQRWGLTELLEVQTILGRTRFDLRHARPLNPEEDVEMTISCVLGTVELLVPYGTRVRLDGTTYLGGSSSDVTESEPDADPDVWTPPTSIPPLDITANVILGRVRVHTPDRPASNTWFSRLMDRRRRRQSSNRTSVKSVAKPTPGIGAAPAPVLAPVAPAPVDVSAPPPAVAAAVDVAVPAPVPAAPAPTASVEAARLEPAPVAVAPVEAGPAPSPEPAPAPQVADDTERFEPSEPDEDALGDTNDWRAEAEAEAEAGGWSLSLEGEEPADAEESGDDGMDGWTILPA